MLDRIRIVMVNTSHAGNIGAAARAMKVMGLKQLWLVDPVTFTGVAAGDPGAGAEGPHSGSREVAMASGAVDLLAAARVVTTLDEALAGCSLVLGASARVRTVPWPHLMADRGAATALEQLQVPGSGDVAFVFGRENSGLNNDELARCHFHVEIPGNPEYPVLNVAAAIQVIAWELRRQWLAGAGASSPADGRHAEMTLERVRWDKPPATADELEKFFAHLEKTLLDLEFFVVDDPRQLLVRLRRLFLRARPDEVEMKILRGILGAAQRAAAAAAAGKAGEKSPGGK
ncbi:MAG: RNA methyltransferase [Gammaproteobacteria bacterium]